MFLTDLGVFWTDPDPFLEEKCPKIRRPSKYSDILKAILNIKYWKKKIRVDFRSAPVNFNPDLQRCFFSQKTGGGSSVNNFDRLSFIHLSIH